MQQFASTSPAPSRFTVRDAGEMQSVGESMARALRPGDLVLLHGELGAGKTTLSQGLARGLGAATPVTSPTFVLVIEHATPVAPLLHLDAYRLEGLSFDETREAGLEEFFGTHEAIRLVEWPSMIPEWIDAYARAESTWQIRIEHAGSMAPTARRARWKYLLPPSVGGKGENTMIVLGIEGARVPAGVSLLLVDEEEESVSVGALALVEKSESLSGSLLHAIDAVLEQSGASLEEVGALCVGIGPGSWTGLRVTLSLAKTLAQAREIEIAGVPSFDALAQAAWRALEEESSAHRLLLVVGECRPGELYAKVFEASEEFLAPAQDEWIARPSEIWMRHGHRPCRVTSKRRRCSCVRRTIRRST
jgi:tRNA threonylcarbamoyladenosine biosynthesis protein TsaE